MGLLPVGHADACALPACSVLRRFNAHWVLLLAMWQFDTVG